ncbi:MAG: 2-phospho-L-lactate guanylyltransferase CofC [Actinomycetia bacterium]|nr:2-phospho-L-lactate guanylyltransferase CofC [Actinomycetes bacterium]
MQVLVPLKRLDRAKTRLDGLLDAPGRARLMRALLEHTLTEVKRAPSVSGVVLVSSDPASAAIANEHGVAHFDDRGLPWNDALAAAVAESVSSQEVAIVAGDLPLVSADDVEALIAAMPERGVAIARARDAGTNAVAMRPAGAMHTCFGTPGSAARHAELAAAAGLDAVIADIAGLAIDLDSPDDVREALGRDLPDAVRAALATTSR